MNVIKTEWRTRTSFFETLFILDFKDSSNRVGNRSEGKLHYWSIHRWFQQQVHEIEMRNTCKRGSRATGRNVVAEQVIVLYI